MLGPGDLDDTPQGPIDLERLLPAAVARILQDEDPAEFRAWLAENLAAYAGPELQTAPAAMFRSMAMPVSYMIWNATPLPGNNFRPRPLPLPNRNDRCPCESGLKYKKCCNNAPPFPVLDPLMLWPLVLQNLPHSQIQQAAAAGHLPLEARTLAATDMLEHGRARQAVALLRPHFEQLPKKPRNQDDMMLQVLCDAYDECGQRDKKLALLERITREGASSPLRAGAWQRLAVIRLDRNDLDGARKALEQAILDNPDEPFSAFIELQLLAKQEHWDQIRARADFWLRKLRRPLYDPEAVAPIIDLLEKAADNPEIVLGLLEEPLEDFDEDVELDEACVRLLDWIDKVVHRPLPTYRAVEEDETPADEEQLAAKFRRMGLSDDDISNALSMLDKQKQKLFEGESEETPVDDESLILVPPAALPPLEAQWHKLFGLSKPFSIQNVPAEAWDGWDPGHEEPWLKFLENHPEAADSLEIIDDLLNAMFLHPDEQQGPALIIQGSQPLLERATAIVEQAVSDLEHPLLRWSRTENRDGLRSLYRLYSLTRHGREDLMEAERLAFELLRLNPQDNHGLRAELMNDLLRRGQNEKAQELARLFPDDSFAQTRYGRLLALYRRGQLNSVQELAEAAVEEFPLIARFMVRARVKRPKLSEHGIRIGGEDQAWLYREEMRDLWQDTPGALDWLKKIMKIKGVRC